MNLQIRCICSFTSLYSLMSFVRPLSSISPNGLLVSGHLKDRFQNLSFFNEIGCTYVTYVINEQVHFSYTMQM